MMPIDQPSATEWWMVIWRMCRSGRGEDEAGAEQRILGEVEVGPGFDGAKPVEFGREFAAGEMGDVRQRQREGGFRCDDLQQLAVLLDEAGAQALHGARPASRTPISTSSRSSAPLSSKRTGTLNAGWLGKSFSR